MPDGEDHSLGRSDGQAARRARQKHMMDEASFALFPSFPSHRGRGTLGLTDGSCEPPTETERRKDGGGEQLSHRCLTRSRLFVPSRVRLVGFRPISK